jgi:anti-sigma factor RsiW
MSLCESIEPLAMAYLDDELVSEERRELETHLVVCTGCREIVDRERADIALVRAALVAPPAPDLFKARLAKALDEEARVEQRTQRMRPLALIGRYILPGAATLAAVAAIAVFVFVRPPATPQTGAVASEVVRQQKRSLPLEVQGASTGPWLRQHFAPVEPPQFAEPGIRLEGARLTAVAGHEAALLKYVVSIGRESFGLTAMVIEGLRGNELTGGQAIKVGERTLYVHDADGRPAVTFVDEFGMTYVFASDRLQAQQLLELVVSSDLIGRAQQAR